MRMIPRFLLLSLLASSAAMANPGGRAGEVEVELLTIGPGDTLFSAFGHTGLMVLHDGYPEKVYNFGYADFDQPNLVLRFLRGKMLFYVAHETWAQMKRDCREENRSLSRQSLALSSAQHRALAALLAEQVKPENRNYSYHHYWNNCATRPRDLLDQVLDGAVRRRLHRDTDNTTLRELTRQGFAGHLLVQTLADLVLGRPGDRNITPHEEGFLPASLSFYLQDWRFAGVPMEVIPRDGPLPDESHHGHGLRNLNIAALLALALALALALLARNPSPWQGLPLAGLAVMTSLPALLVWSLALVTPLPELRQNELLFSLWPTDLLLLWPAVRWMRGRLWAGPTLRLYALARLVAIGWVVVGHLSGALFQQPLAPVIVAACLALSLWLAVRRLPPAQ